VCLDHVGSFMKWTVTAKFLQLVVGMALAILPYSSLAKIFVVNSTGDLPDTSPADGICQTTAGDCTLRAAIMQANSTPEEDAIVFAPNVTGTITLSGSELQILGAPLIIQGPGANRLTVDANFMSRVLFIQAPGFAVSISGLTLTHGMVVGAGAVGGSSGGGCIYNEANLTLNSCTVSNSSTTGGDCFGGDCDGGSAWGGAILAE
jgi:CSLREA domain-containing protein